MKIETEFEYYRSKKIVEELKAQIDKLQNNPHKSILRKDLLLASFFNMKEEIENEIVIYESKK